MKQEYFFMVMHLNTTMSEFF